MTASKELLEKLHNVVGEKLYERIASGEATAAEFGQAIKFLQNNGIEALPEGNDALTKLEGSLKERLPFSDLNDPTTYQ
ncbi:MULTISPECIES: hypothetical protein [unclassified Thioalkalivibrio]|uniref:hypothetical protein n=1 Tax=unclassified Thioalkalivibrio TaxID=2621013 RepID=UPI000380E6D9|nr:MULTISPECIES: hypothetical protein [unclassified Thioalkalivibrio]